MNVKTVILAATAALAVAVPAAAFAQPAYRDYGRHEEFRRDRDDWRVERQREIRREEWRRLQWQREHAWRPYYR